MRDERDERAGGGGHMPQFPTFTPPISSKTPVGRLGGGGRGTAPRKATGLDRLDRLDQLGSWRNNYQEGKLLARG